jgi:hypothetical protein
LSKTQAQKLSEWWNTSLVETTKTFNEQKAAAVKQQTEALQKEWGSAYQQNVELAKAAASKFKISSELLTKLESNLGGPETMKFLVEVGRATMESKYVGSTDRGQGFGVMSPAQAKHEISALQTDRDFMSRFGSGDRKAIDRMSQLHEWAFPSSQDQ